MLVSLVRFQSLPPILARWQNGYVEDCNSLYIGSIPVLASNKDQKTTEVSKTFALYSLSGAEGSTPLILANQV